MRIEQVAAQLYTVREQCKTAGELAASARKIREIGYTAVQVSGIGAAITDEEVVRIMDGEGLAICATHEPSDVILADPARCIARLQRLGCALTAYPFHKDVDLADPAAVARLARQLDAAGAKFRAAGLTLGYHNHAREFVKHDGVTVLEYLYANTEPANLAAELDTYWVHYGGGDVVEWCRRMRGRLPFVHLKDYGFTAANVPVYREIGGGTLPFARIVAEAEASGCAWFIVEQDECPGDPFVSLRQSFEYLAAQICVQPAVAGAGVAGHQR